MLSEQKTDFIDHIGCLIDKALVPHEVNQFSARSPMGRIFNTVRLNIWSWGLVSFFIAEIGRFADARPLFLPRCATSIHHCCPEPSYVEEHELDPLCETLSNNPGISLLVLGVLYASELPEEYSDDYDTTGASFAILSSLSKSEREVPMVCKLARAMKKKVDHIQFFDPSGCWDWCDTVDDSIRGFMDDGFVLLPQ
jgi:hypothetical protein